MCKLKVLIFMSLALAIAGFCLGTGQVAAQPAPLVSYTPETVPNPAMGFNPNVNYTLPNFAISPNTRKFVDSLPGLGAPGCTPGTGTPPNVTGGTCNQNNLGQYIPIAIPDTATYPGSAFYDIGLGNYSDWMHSDLYAPGKPGTALRGYYQVKGAGAGQTNDPAIGGVQHYLGPAIIARVYNPNKPAGIPSAANLFNVGGNGWPVRLRFTNNLPLSNNATTCAANPAGSPKLCLPVDTGIMGAGFGPMGPAPYGTTACDMGTAAAPGCNMFPENRVTIPHLHGGRTPWISDGTPFQWITPVGDPMPGNAITGFPWGMKKGASLVNVPDMIGAGAGHVANTANDGMGTNFYTNQQSARLMFWHDHAYGITRLNVYKGVAAPYLLIDQVEDDLIDGTNLSTGNPAAKPIIPNVVGGVYRYGIPLVIQDKAFVNDASTDAVRSPNFPIGTYDPTSHTYETQAAVAGSAANDCWNAASANYYLKVADSRCGTDPLWNKYVGTTGGQLWAPHEYLPVENIYSATGGTANGGRWDYGPFLIPPMIPRILTIPSPILTPEAFVDTMVVNGTAFPYLELPPVAVRFRILAVPNDRTLNLSWFKADPLTISIQNRGSGYAVPPAAPPVVTITNAVGDATSTYTSATATVSTGVITNISPDASCLDFTAPPIVTVTPVAPDTPATATCSSPITAVIMTNSHGQVVGFQGFQTCTGFSVPPTVTVSDGGGLMCNATATVVPPGQILNIAVVGATGYRSAPTVTVAAPPAGTTATAVAWGNTEVRMVDAAPNPAYPTWPVDGRDGGVPDPTTQGPPWLLIGNEGGLLAQASVIPAQPIDYEYNRLNLPFAGFTSHSLLMLPAMRADVIVDFGAYKDGDTLILYNDAGAPAPGWWPQNDIFTDGPDMRAITGPPPIPPGFGPNTRTVMQVRIKGTKPAGYAWDFSYPNGASLLALKTAIPKAFAVGNDKPIVPQTVYNDAFPGFASQNMYVEAPDSTINMTGTGQGIARIKAIAPGNNYTVAPKVVIIGDGTGAAATAGLNPCGGLTLLSTGSGYATPPTCTIGTPGAGGVRATCVATVSGGIVNAIQIDEPGSNYSTVTAASCTLGPPAAGGVQATCSTFVAVANTMGSITITNPGSGYTREPRVYIVPNNPQGMGATAVALLTGAQVFTYKNIMEGFDPNLGVLNILMGSTPNPLTPNIGAAFVMGANQYIDPPAEILTDGQITFWRITHLGVDSHALHFHLFDVQVINRLDATNVVKPPYPDELGWRDTIRTNPLEDIIVAFRPHTVPLPFAVPSSNRLLDNTTPVNSTTNYWPIAPPAGIAAVPQVSNIMTNFGWEYVFHCHMLSHEEFDFMRPMVFTGSAPAAIANLSAVTTFPTPATAQVVLSWTGNYPTATGFTVQRDTVNTFNSANLKTWSVVGNPPPNTYTDTTPAQNTLYYYRVAMTNAWGASAYSAALAVPTVAVPSGFALSSITPVNAATSTVKLSWNAPGKNPTNYTLQRLDFNTGLVSYAVAGNLTSFSQNVARGNTYWYRIRANVTGVGSSAYTTEVAVVVP